MKNTFVFLLSLLFILACNKEDVPLPREKFLGSYQLFILPDSFSHSGSVIGAGAEDHQMIWDVQGETIQMEFIGKNDSMAFGTKFTLFLLYENFASLTFIHSDTILGQRSSGSIFFPSTYKHKSFKLVRNN